MRRPEHALQVAVAHMRVQVVLDPVLTWWTSIDHGVGRLGVVEASQRKRRGVKPGIPDIIIMWDCGMLIGLELKAGRGRASDAQTEIAEMWSRLGFGVWYARSLEEVQSVLEHAGVPDAPPHGVLPEAKVIHTMGVSMSVLSDLRRPRHRRARRQKEIKKPTCPWCSPARRKKSDPCLSVLVEADHATWNCWHCGAKGGMGNGSGTRPGAGAPRPRSRDGGKAWLATMRRPF